MISATLPSLSTIDKYARDPAFAKLAVLILSRNRPKFLERQVRWWSRTAAQILIADGSDDPNAHLKNLSDSSITVSYINTVGLSDRFRWASTKVQRKYTLIAGDDDLYLFSGVLACIRVLEAEVNVGTCVGQSMSFALDGADFEPGFSPAYQENVGYQRLEALAEDRTIKRGAPYTVCCFYSVQRTHVSQIAWQILAKMGEPDSPPHHINNYLYELTYEFVSTFLAPIKTVNSLMWLRSTENIPLREIEGPKDIQFHNWVALRSSESAMRTWFEIVTKDLALFDPSRDVGAIKEILEGAIASYLSQYPRRRLLKYLDPQRYKLKIQYEATKIMQEINLQSVFLQKLMRVFDLNMPVRVTDIHTQGEQVDDHTHYFEGRLIDTEELREVAKIIRDFHLHL